MKLSANARRLRAAMAKRPWWVALLVAVGLPAALLAAASAHFWSTASDFADYRPVEPSRLFAAPLLVTPGMPLAPETFAESLRALGYAPVERTPLRGEFRRTGVRFTVGLRSEQVSVSGAPLPGGASLVVELGDQRVRRAALGGRELERGQLVDLGRPLLYTYYDESLRDCWPVRLAELPDHVVHALLAAEDARFFRHPGVAPAGIARAAWRNARAGEVQQGGSTITQQLVKNLYLRPRRTVARKGREAVLALLLEARYSKRRILEAYLNEIYWGAAGDANLHGIGAAARAYFGKPPAELGIGEAATLAGMVPAPAASSPLSAPAEARRRRDGVLRRMVEQGWLDERRAAAEIERPIVVRPQPLRARRAPWFAAAISDEARQRFELESLGGTGHRLHATLSLPEQLAAEQEVERGLRELRQRWNERPELEGALVSLDPTSGRILAWVGGRNWERSQFDRVFQARRQAGSAFKPVVYAAALEDGRLTPWELLRDSPILVRQDRTTWRPRNSDGRFHGEVSARASLERSLNVPAVRVAMRAGLGRVTEVAHAMGIGSPLPEVPALALGACEVTALELAVAYSTLAADGRRPAPWGLEEILDPNGEPLAGEPVAAPQRVLSADTAYMVTSMLRGVLDRGTAWSARSLGVRGALAGKTGTTDDRRDSWFAGYSADRVTVVWVGYDDNRRSNLSGSRGALPLWSRFTARVTPAGGYRPLTAPPGFATVELDPETGLRAGAHCPRRVREELPAWRVPLRDCDLHQPAEMWAHELRLPYGAPPARELRDLLSGGDPDPPPVRLQGDVTRLFGEGRRIGVDRGTSPPALEVSEGPGVAPVAVAPDEPALATPPMASASGPASGGSAAAGSAVSAAGAPASAGTGTTQPGIVESAPIPPR